MTNERIFFNFTVTADSHTLPAYKSRGGYQALETALKTLQPIDVEKEVMASGLRGRGGAGFPTGSKWSFVNKKAPVVFLCRRRRTRHLQRPLDLRIQLAPAHRRHDFSILRLKRA
jgi:NADH:ubiquinone oxidoreductase subunit F (NADH-binding)